MSSDPPIGPTPRRSPWELSVAPPPERWDDWTELDASAWPERRERHYRCIPTICFNCESACGLLAYVDKQTGETVKFEGNPLHPGSRGRTCAKGPATLNQVKDPERILTPLRRVGPRGAGRWVEASWDEALADIGGRIRKALQEKRHDEVVYHVGRPGEDHFVNRMLQAWGIDGHDSHTNVCSSSARTGYALWAGFDRPSPDYSQAKFALLLSAHLETGHYFNPHAQRIVEAMERGMRVAVIDSRLSNTASRATHWVATWPGTETALLLGLVRELLVRERLERGAIDRDFVRRWTNWERWLEAKGRSGDFDDFLAALAADHERFTPEYVERECRVPAGTLGTLADEIAAAGTRFTSHLWRNAAAGHLHGWQTARSLLLLHVLTGSLGVPGGLNPNSWDKFTPRPSRNPPPFEQWNEALWPREYPLAHYEMSFLLPHLLERQGRRIEVYFTRVYNPVWTNPDGCSWIEMLENEERIGCHVALTPTWNETAQWADWVLPTGLASERHDLMSQETHAGTWIGFRQPVGREHLRRSGRDPGRTLGTNPGQVWEEAELWIDLTWRIDPDGAMGIRTYFESKENPGEPISMDEYWADVFEHAVPGLPEAAAKMGISALEYMKRHGAYEVPYAGQRRFEAVREGGVELEDGTRRAGWETPSGKLELWSDTLADWGFPEQAVPDHAPSQVHWKELDFEAGERALLPTFRLPTLIHTRSGNSKWLQELSHTNPLWVHPEDVAQLGLGNGGLARITTQIGHFVVRVWETEGIHPGVVACSHHAGRWRLHREVGGAKLSTARVSIERGEGTFLFRQEEPVGPHESLDPDTQRIWWKETGVNQNLTFPVQPDPVSGMHCWHQRVRVEPAREGDRHGDVFVDTRKSRAVLDEWLKLTRPAPGPGGLRRPLWLKRPQKPTERAYRLD